MLETVALVARAAVFRLGSAPSTLLFLLHSRFVVLHLTRPAPHMLPAKYIPCISKSPGGRGLYARGQHHRSVIQGSPANGGAWHRVGEFIRCLFAGDTFAPLLRRVE